MKQVSAFALMIGLVGLFMCACVSNQSSTSVGPSPPDDPQQLRAAYGGLGGHYSVPGEGVVGRGL